MNDSERQLKIRTYIDGWMEQLNALAKQYQAAGLSAEEALDRATTDIRMKIRRAPPIDLEDIA